MELGTIYVIAGLVGIVNTILFWVLCSNVAKIKKSAAKGVDYYTAEFKKNVAFGNKKEAKKALEEYMWLYKEEKFETTMSKDLKQRRESEFKKHFTPMMEKVGMDFPVGLFNTGK